MLAFFRKIILVRELEIAVSESLAGGLDKCSLWVVRGEDLVVSEVAAEDKSVHLCYIRDCYSYIYSHYSTQTKSQQAHQQVSPFLAQDESQPPSRLPRSSPAATTYYDLTPPQPLQPPQPHNDTHSPPLTASNAH